MEALAQIWKQRMMYGLATTLRFRMIRNINKNRNFWRKWHKVGREDIFDFATTVFEMQMGVQMKMPRWKCWE